MRTRGWLLLVLAGACGEPTGAPGGATDPDAPAGDDAPAMGSTGANDVVPSADIHGVEIRWPNGVVDVPHAWSDTVVTYTYGD